MNTEKLEAIKNRLQNISLAGWEAFHSEDAFNTTIRVGNSIVEFPTDGLHSVSWCPNTAEFIKYGPQDMMDLIEALESKNA